MLDDSNCGSLLVGDTKDLLDLLLEVVEISKDSFLVCVVLKKFAKKRFNPMLSFPTHIRGGEQRLLVRRYLVEQEV